MLEQAKVNNPKDYAVVSFHNSTNFDFTPEMGCMYDGRPINGVSGKLGIISGETMMLPYHVGMQLAKNLAKRILNTSPQATVDAVGIPTGVSIWSSEKLDEETKKFIKELYTEEKPVAQSETDKLMAKVEEYRKLVEEKLGGLENTTENGATIPTQFVDKKEVIDELEKKGITFDRRKSKAELEKLLA